MQTQLEAFRANVRRVDRHQVTPSSFDAFAPLVIGGAMRRALTKWTDPWLVRHFGDGTHQVSLDSRPAFGGSYSTRMDLADYLQALAEGGDSLGYLFQSRLERDFESAAELIDDLDIPEAILALGSVRKWRLLLGPAFSGALPHNHRFTINALARGRKRWAIYLGRDERQTERLLQECYEAYDSGTHSRDWFADACPALRSRPGVQLWEFIQEPGEVVYIPDWYLHATVNLEPVLGFAAELVPGDEGFARAPGRRPAMRGRGPAWPRRGYAR